MSGCEKWLNRIVCGDALEVLKEMPDACIDLVFTDPPYKKEYNYLYGAIAQESSRLLKDQGMLAIMCGQSYLPEVLMEMSKFLIYRWTMAYLMLGGQASQIWQRSIITFWKPVFLFSKNEHNKNWFGDVVKSKARDKKYHKWGQSESGMVDLLKRISNEHDIILDPFLGCGTTAIAAKALNRNFIGIELNPQYVEMANRRLAGAMPFFDKEIKT